MEAPVSRQKTIKINDTDRWTIGNPGQIAVWEKVTRLAVQMAETPIATIALESGDRQWLSALVGLPSAAIPQVLALCTAVECQPEDRLNDADIEIVSDTHADTRLAHLPLVKTHPQIRFYAAVAICNVAGEKWGKLCVMGFEPQPLSDKQIAGLRALATLCANQLDAMRLATTNCSGANDRPDCPPNPVDRHLPTVSPDRDNASTVRAMPPPLTIEEYLKNLLSHLPIAIYRCNSTGDLHVRYCITDRIAATIGYPRSPFAIALDAALSDNGSCNPANRSKEGHDRTIVEEEITQTAIDGQPYVLQDLPADAYGRIKWIGDGDRGLFSQKGERVYIDGIVMDSISQNSSPTPSPHPHPPESANATSFTSAPTDPLLSDWEGYFALDFQWNFIAINSRAREIFHKSERQLIGRNFWEEFPVWETSTLADAYQQVMAQNVRVKGSVFYPPLAIHLEMQVCPKAQGLAVYFQEVPPEKNQQPLQPQPDRFGTFCAEMGMLLARGGAVSDLLDRCCQAIVAHLNAASANLWIFNPAREQLELHCSAGQPLDLTRFPERIGLGETAIGIVAQSRQSDSFPLAENSPTRLLVQPLIADEQVFGAIAVALEPSSTSLDSLLLWVASGLAVAIDRDRTRLALLSRREGLLFRLASQIRNSLDLDTILETAVTEIHNLLQIDRCHFLWYLSHPIEPSLTVTHESRSPGQPSLLCEYPASQSGPLAEKIRNLESLRIDALANPADLDEPTRSLFADMGIGSVLLLSLETRSGQLGAVVCSHSCPRPWKDSEVELLQGVVDQLALAIDQAELYAQTHAAALAAQTQAQQLSVALQNLKQTQSQLIQTEKMSSLGQMVAGIAHEINNPVNFITGNLVHANNYTQDLLQLIETYQQHYPDPVSEVVQVAEDIDLEFLSEDLPKILASMQMGADRIRQIVVSLRNFSRLDEAEMKPVDIHEGIDNTLLILHNRWKPKGKDPGVEIVKHYGELPKVECYAGQLNQVFMNILANGMDALENQSAPHIITISTAIAKTDAQGKPSQVAICIRDNGPGMTEEVKKRLFDPFFTTKPVGKGTGLGLSISYKIVVEKHGGILRCDSEPGQGSEFLIQIPVKQPEVSDRWT